MQRGIRLLVVTQAVDLDDPVLGFFHAWLTALSARVESIEVICLKKGRHALPANVSVHSLGKEHGPASSLAYAARFLRLAWRLRSAYTTVFVHMNQEYVLLGGLLWRAMGKRVLLWRNHKQGNFLTDMAVLLSDRTFSTSPESYIATYKKTSLMPVGVDTDFFRRKPEIPRASRSILFLGRISPVKKVEEFVRGLAELKKNGVPCTARIVGDPTPRDVGYARAIRELVKDLALEHDVMFQPGVRHEETVDLYNGNEVYVNLTPSGSMDKTIFEAMAAETVVLVANRALQGKIDRVCILDSSSGLSARLAELLALPEKDRESLARSLRAHVVSDHSLEKLAEELCRSMR